MLRFNIAGFYDQKGQLIASIPPNYYEASGTLGGAIPPDATTYTYDFLGRQLTSHSPDSGNAKYIYDNLNQIRFYQDADGEAGGYLNYIQYDNLARIVEKGYYEFIWDDTSQVELQGHANQDPDWPETLDTWSRQTLLRRR